MKQPDELFSEMERADEAERLQLEMALLEALRRVDPPKGFADCLMARIPPPQPSRAALLMVSVRTRLWVGGALAATLLVGAVTGQQLHQRHRRAQAEMASRQFQTAMSITASTLQQVRMQLLQEGVPLGE